VFIKLTQNKESITLIAEQNQKFLGALLANYYLDLDWEGKPAKLQAIIVDKKHQNQGIGRKLIQQFLTQAKENNCQAVTARVNRKNKKANNFYKKQNFEESETNEYILEL